MRLFPIIYVFVLTAPLLIASCHRAETNDDETPEWVARRSPANPLLTTSSQGMVVEHGYADVNGPSVIKVPSWVKNPLGRYYMYFAHHRGSFIRLAYADSLTGPWTVWSDSVLRVADVPALDHVASPDVHVADLSKAIFMYFHSVNDTATWKQSTYLARSRDGLHFVTDPDPLGPPYMRVFLMEDVWWGVAKIPGAPGGVLLRSEYPDGPFHIGPRIIPNMRHAGVLVDGKLADVFFTRIGDEPERIFVTSFDPKKRWIQTEEPAAHEVLRPELAYEGANIPAVASEVGETTEPVNALRDPFVYSEQGRHYLFYAIAGESGIAMATLSKRLPEAGSGR